jgi:hypothetical protein
MQALTALGLIAPPNELRADIQRRLTVLGKAGILELQVMASPEAQ